MTNYEQKNGPQIGPDLSIPEMSSGQNHVAVFVSEGQGIIEAHFPDLL
jgi:hypothetical protein